MNKSELAEILRLHKLWLKKDFSGRRADLVGADLEGAYLYGANLVGADLEGANLYSADLRRANLYGAYLGGANLYGAYLGGANLDGANLPHFKICPERGSFRAFKKTTAGVIEIEIPSKAKRTNSLRGRKCRAEYVKVIGGAGVGGKSPTHGDLVYNKGDIVRADKYNDDIRVECTGGIHFYMTEAEAEEY